jgi:hypothetical protein
MLKSGAGFAEFGNHARENGDEFIRLAQQLVKINQESPPGGRALA